jgi:hypothetical protein
MNLLTGCWTVTKRSGFPFAVAKNPAREFPRANKLRVPHP